MLVCNVVGARPNFMKIAPIVHQLHKRGIPQILVHTGQHYDENMSRVFFEELKLPEPDIYLEVGSDSHARQTARIMIAFEEVCEQQQPDLVIVSGDVNSTVAAAIVASKLGIPIAHVESGLRSFDRSMPEELNRIVTDHLSDLLFTTEKSANCNLSNEGISAQSVHFVGNCMVDTLFSYIDSATRSRPWQAFSLQPRDYALVTLHRPANVDEPDALRTVVSIINETSEKLPIIFPIHPRTEKRLSELNLSFTPTVHSTEPLPYLTFAGLMAKARCVLTDSGGIQEETTALGVPCLTLRPNTERPITIEEGTNKLVSLDRDAIRSSINAILAGNWPSGSRPPLWDGNASVRIVNVIEDWFQASNHTPV